MSSTPASPGPAQPSSELRERLIERDEVLHERYRVAALLGSGRWSQTYLAADLQRGSDAFAIKIYSDHATTEGVDKGHIRELQVLQQIQDVAEDACLPLLKDHFYHSSTQGRHLCLVLPVFCESVDAWRKSMRNKVLDVQEVKQIISMVLEGLDLLHSKDIVHTDIKPDNILIDAAGEKDIRKHLGSVIEGSIPHHYPTTNTAKDKELYTFVLTDFSNAQFVNQPRPAHIISSYALRAPEVILGCSFDQKVDIWAIGCMVFELLAGSWLFKPTEGETWTVEDEHLAQMLEMTGASVFPSTLVQQAQKKDTYLKNDGSLLRIEELLPVPIEKAFATYKVLTERQCEQASAFIRACLTLDPAERPSATQLARHEWLLTSWRPE